MTVMQLRKLAKENNITLGAGIDKAGIIHRILESSAPVPEDPKRQESVNSDTQNDTEPRFQAAWHNADAPRFSAKPAYQAPGTASRPAWQNTTPSGHQLPVQQRVQPLRQGGFTPRFGPAASAPAAPSEPVQPRKEMPAPLSNPLPEHRFSDSSYSHRITSNYTPSYTPARS